MERKISLTITLNEDTDKAALVKALTLLPQMEGLLFSLESESAVTRHERNAQDAERFRAIRNAILDA